MVSGVGNLDIIRVLLLHLSFFLIGGFSYRKLNNRVIPVGNKSWYDNAYKFSPLGGILDTWICI